MTSERQAEALRALLGSDRPARAMGAHSPLSARIAEETGFDCIWSSGLEISAVQAIPDANLLTMDHYLRVAADMARAVNIPVLADCDSGFGDVNNVYHMVEQYESRGIAGVCIEDKQYPKLNSFADGKEQHLASAEEFAAKICAVKAAQRSASFVCVARTEALIVGAGLDEALRRAEIYERAGADALLIHSKARTPEEVLEFTVKYSGRLPVVVVPTSYPSLHYTDLAAHGISMVIYANHGLRSCIAAMRATMERIVDDGTTHFLEPELVSIGDVFAMQGVDDMLRRSRNFEAAGARYVEGCAPLSRPNAAVEIKAL
jgi:phosphoenolpyruvate phosphomutase